MFIPAIASQACQWADIIEAKPCFQCPGGIVNAGMQNPAVAAAGVTADPRFLFKDEDAGGGVTLAQFLGDGEPHDAGTDNEEIG